MEQLKKLQAVISNGNNNNFGRTKVGTCIMVSYIIVLKMRKSSPQKLALLHTTSYMFLHATNQFSGHYIIIAI